MDNIADHEFKIILLGASGVGKTSLTHTYVEGRFNRNRNVTIVTDRSAKELTVRGRRVKLCIWDTAGQERFKSFVTGYFRDVDGVLLVYDVTDVMTFNELSGWLMKVREASPGAVPFVVGNKIDHPDRNAVSQDVVKRFTRDEGLEFMETSAKEGDNVNQIFELLTLKILLSKGLTPHENDILPKATTEESKSEVHLENFHEPVPTHLELESERDLPHSVQSSTIVDSSNTGNSVVGDTITGKSVFGETITGNSVFGETITRNSVVGDSITGNSVVGETTTGNSVIGTSYVGNSVIGSTNAGSSVIGTANTGNSVVGIKNNGTSVVGTAITGNSVIGTTNTGTSVVGTSKSGNSDIGTTNTVNSAVGLTNAGSFVVGKTKTGNTIIGTANTGTSVVGITNTGTSVVGTTNNGNTVIGTTSSNAEQTVSKILSVNGNRNIETARGTLDTALLSDSCDDILNSFVFVCYDRNLPPIVPLNGNVPQLQVGRRRTSADSVLSLVPKSEQNIKLHVRATLPPKEKKCEC